MRSAHRPSEAHFGHRRIDADQAVERRRQGRRTGARISFQPRRRGRLSIEAAQQALGFQQPSKLTRHRIAGVH